MSKKTKTIEQIEAHLKRLRSRLKRTVNAIEKWERAKARVRARTHLQAQAAQIERKIRPSPPVPQPEAPRPKVQPEPRPATATPIPPETAKELQAANRELNRALLGSDPLDIRNMPWAKRNEADEKAKAEILAEQEARKKTKAKSRIEKMKADRRAMPLSGKAAAAKLRE